MASTNEQSSTKRRLGRRRLPPLEPGPDLQFVIANHPDQFRAGKTMRNVRSHVMYKNRIERKTSTNGRLETTLQRSASAHTSETPSPSSVNLEGTSSDVDYLVPPPSRPRSGTWSAENSPSLSYAASSTALRPLIHRILSSTHGTYARSAPPFFEDASAFPFPGFYNPYRDPLQDLKRLYIECCTFNGGDREWLQTVCVDQISFLSHVCVSSVYQDLLDGFWEDSGTTMQAKTHALSAIAGQLESSDATILSILHLLLSEVGGDENAFRVHYQGLQGLIERRGGMRQLSHQLFAYVTLILTTLATLKHLPNFNTSHALSIGTTNTHEPSSHISPLFPPHDTFATLRTICPAHTFGILTTMHSLTQTLLHTNTTHVPFTPTRQHIQLHNNLLSSPSIQDSSSQAWIHESIRLAALIQSHAILHCTSLATAANTPCHPPISSTQPSTSRPSTTLLTALLNSVSCTDTLHGWETLRGVFIWVCVIGGAASWTSHYTESTRLDATQLDSSRLGSSQSRMKEVDTEPASSSPHMAWARKCFSLWAVRAVVGGGFEHIDGMVEMLRTGQRVREVLEGWEG